MNWSIVRVITGRRGYPQNAGVLVVLVSIVIELNEFDSYVYKISAILIMLKLKKKLIKKLKIIFIGVITYWTQISSKSFLKIKKKMYIKFNHFPLYKILLFIIPLGTFHWYAMLFIAYVWILFLTSFLPRWVPVTKCLQYAQVAYAISNTF